MTQSREWFQDESLTDEQLLARCYDELRRGPVGLWSTYGDELTRFSGLTVVFATAGTGVVYCWATGEGEKHQIKDHFRWKSENDFEVDLDPIQATNPADRWGRIRYRFHLDFSPYRTRQVNITEVDPPHPCSPQGDFWWAVGPLKLMSTRTDFDFLPGEDV